MICPQSLSTWVSSRPTSAPVDTNLEKPSLLSLRCGLGLVLGKRALFLPERPWKRGLMRLSQCPAASLGLLHSGLGAPVPLTSTPPTGVGHQSAFPQTGRDMHQGLSGVLLKPPLPQKKPTHSPSLCCCSRGSVWMRGLNTLTRWPRLLFLKNLT